MYTFTVEVTTLKSTPINTIAVTFTVGMPIDCKTIVAIPTEIRTYTLSKPIRAPGNNKTNMTKPEN